MAIKGTPAAGSFIKVKEEYPAGANSAVPLTEEPNVGSSTGDQFTVGTGGPRKVSVQASFQLDLVASTPQTVDLAALPGVQGAKSLSGIGAKVVRIEHLGAEDAAGTVTPSATGTNAWTNGPFNATGSPIVSGGQLYQDCPKTAGWAVTGTNKVLTFTPSAHNQSIRVSILG